MTDLHAWKAALSGEKNWWRDEPICGYWRISRGKVTAWKPVVIYAKGSKIVCELEGKETPWWKVWSPYIEPITEEEYLRIANGGKFDDEYYEKGTSSVTRDVTRAAPICPPSRRKDARNKPPSYSRAQQPSR